MAKPAPDLAVAAALFERINPLSRLDIVLVIAAIVVIVASPVL